jgi:hypothetical protein
LAINYRHSDDRMSLCNYVRTPSRPDSALCGARNTDRGRHRRRYLPLEIGEKIVTHDLGLEPIFTLLEQRYDIPLLEAEYKLEAISADQDVAVALGVEAGSPIFLIERTSYSVGDRPVDYEKLHYRGDLIRFRTRLARRKLAGV